MAAALPVIVNEFGEVGIDHHLRHERFVFHFMPTSCSWLNAVKGFFAKLSRRRLKRGVFRSVVDLQAAINRKSGLDEALGLAIGLGSVGPGEDLAKAEAVAGCPERL